MHSRLQTGYLFLLAFTLSIITAISIARAQEGAVGVITSGDAAVTGFSGTIDQAGQKLINPDGASLRIFGLSNRGPARGQLLDAPIKNEYFARDIGQVFGVALDNAINPNIYVTATSAYGISIVGPDGSPLANGAPGASFMPGQFGATGGPGSIWKVDGATGEVSLFANLQSAGQDNSGAGLGNIVFDPSHYQLFVSDLASGLIHRVDMRGNVIDTFDHGSAGRPAGGLDPVAIDPANRLDITNPDFDVENSDTWGLADIRRRVWGMAYFKGRLYYAPVEGPQIWSVGINRDGSFASDARIDIQNVPGGFPVSDMLFTPRGQMIVAQRGGMLGSRDYTQLHTSRADSVLRYSRNADGTWIQEQDEYAIGFPVNHKNASGGVGLACSNILWSTGDALRDNPDLADNLARGGQAVVHGLQGNDVSLVRPRNTPPWKSWFVDFDGKFNDPENTGHVGDIEVYRDCKPGFAESWPGWEPGWTPPDGWTPPPWWPQYPDLELIKDDALCTPLQRGFSMECTYTLTVTNVGAGTFTGTLQITDNPPANSLFIPPPGGSIPWNCGQLGGPGTPVNCTSVNIETLLPGQSENVVLTFRRQADQRDQNYENCAVVNYPGDNPVNNEDCGYGYPPGPDLEIIKTLEDCYPELGGSVCLYYLDVTNNGNAVYNGMVHLIEEIPAGSFYDGMISSSNPAWTCGPFGGLINCLLAPALIPVGATEWVEVAIFIPEGSPDGLENCVQIGRLTNPADPDVNGNNRSCAPVIAPADFSPRILKSGRKSCPSGWTMQQPGWIAPKDWEAKSVGPVVCGRKKPKKTAHCPRGWNRYPSANSVPKGWKVQKVGNLTCAKYQPPAVTPDPVTPVTPVIPPKCKRGERTFQDRYAVPRGWNSHPVSRSGITIWCASRKPVTLACPNGDRQISDDRHAPRGTRPYRVRGNGTSIWCARPVTTRLFCNGEDRQIPDRYSAPQGYKVYPKTRNGKTIWCASWSPHITYCPRGDKKISGPYAAPRGYRAYRYNSNGTKIWCAKPIVITNPCRNGERQFNSRRSIPRGWKWRKVARTYCASPGGRQCKDGYRFRNGRCIPDQVSCPTGMHPEAGTCMPNRLECKRGTHLSRGKCVPNVIECKRGLRLYRGKCVPDIKYCRPGTTLKRGKCVPNVIRCKNGTRLYRGKCVPNIKYCRPGTTLKRGKCVPNVIRCRPGTHLYRGKCLKDGITVPQTGGTIYQPPKKPTIRACRRGQVFRNGRCRTITLRPVRPAKPTIARPVNPTIKRPFVPTLKKTPQIRVFRRCNKGYRLVNGKCVR